MAHIVSLMQPYLFPYLGYFQLIAASSLFLLGDSLQYTRRGWINRNRLLVGGQPWSFSFPLEQGSRSQAINERLLSTQMRPTSQRLLHTIRHAYSRAPCYRQVFPLVEEILEHPERNLARFAEHSIRRICHYMGIDTPIERVSELDLAPDIDRDRRLIEAVRRSGGDVYLNPEGGRHLYCPDLFHTHGVELRFLRMDELSYRQFDDNFVPSLSIIDVLMFNPPDEMQRLLGRYSVDRPAPSPGSARPGVEEYES
ncbi:WbqC family protein [Pseudomonas sp. MT3]|nr:WbqC family protein [uncultured Pseudomonas sp.]